MNKPECRTYPTGTKRWYLNGNLHREDGPACEFATGGKSWWLNGKRHREDGPAVEHSDGFKSWWLNHEEVHPETIVDLWLSRGVFCWYDETNDCLDFGEKMNKLKKYKSSLRAARQYQAELGIFPNTMLLLKEWLIRFFLLLVFLPLFVIITLSSLPIIGILGCLTCIRESGIIYHLWISPWKFSNLSLQESHSSGSFERIYKEYNRD